jgi:hypothetical protein
MRSVKTGAAKPEVDSIPSQLVNQEDDRALSFQGPYALSAARPRALGAGGRRRVAHVAPKIMSQEKMSPPVANILRYIIHNRAAAS